MSRRRVYADDHMLLEVLGYLAGVPLGRCCYMSTAVIRVAVEEWVEALRIHPELGPDVERLITDERYRHEQYQLARQANPSARRAAEHYAMQCALQDDERRRHELVAGADAEARRRAVDAGKVKIMPRRDSRAEP